MKRNDEMQRNELSILRLLASVESNMAMTREQEAAISLHERWARDSSDLRSLAGA